MKPFKLIRNTKFVEWWGKTFGIGDIRGVIPFPFIVVVKNPFEDGISQKESSKRFLVVFHEWIHIQQMIELLVVGYLVWYCVELLFGWVKYGHFKTAYRNVIFEREAYKRTARIRTMAGACGAPIRPKWGWVNYYGREEFVDKRPWRNFYSKSKQVAQIALNEYIFVGWEQAKPLRNKPRWWKPGEDRWYFKVVKR